MTPQERQLIDDLFGRLERAETAPRDAEAEESILQGLRRAPHAVYTLVQTVLLQEEALKRATARIDELEQGRTQTAGSSANQGSFLDSLRDSLFGGSPQSSRGSVPNVPPSSQVWNTQPQQSPYGDPRYANAPGYGANPAGYGAPQSGGGSSFLGTAAAAAAGMIGGSLLMNSLRGMGSSFGGGGQSFGDSNLSGDNHRPWGGSDSNDSLARDAGINDIGRNDDRHQSFADTNQSSNDVSNDDNNDDGDFGSDDSSYA